MTSFTIHRILPPINTRVLIKNFQVISNIQQLIRRFLLINEAYCFNWNIFMRS